MKTPQLKRVLNSAAHNIHILLYCEHLYEPEVTAVVASVPNLAASPVAERSYLLQISLLGDFQIETLPNNFLPRAFWFFAVCGYAKALRTRLKTACTSQFCHSINIIMSKNIYRQAL